MGKQPLIRQIKTFSFLAYVHNHQILRDKFHSRSRPCVFMGYPFGKKGWRLFDTKENTFIISQDAVFIENQFPFAKEVHNLEHGHNIVFEKHFVKELILLELLLVHLKTGPRI